MLSINKAMVEINFHNHQTRSLLAYRLKRDNRNPNDDQVFLLLCTTAASALSCGDVQSLTESGLRWFHVPELLFPSQGGELQVVQATRPWWSIPIVLNHPVVRKGRRKPQLWWPRPESKRTKTSRQNPGWK